LKLERALGLTALVCNGPDFEDVESCHWRLDVTFREDGNHTLDKAAAYNLNIVKKMAINTLRLVDAGIARISMKNKRCLISMNFRRNLEILTAL
jgi:hypothetical protein